MQIIISRMEFHKRKMRMEMSRKWSVIIITEVS